MEYTRLTDFDLLNMINRICLLQQTKVPSPQWIQAQCVVPNQIAAGLPVWYTAL